MDGDAYRRTEGLLYGLRRPPEPALARPARTPASSRPVGPRAPIRQVARRVDLGIAVERAGLTDDERQAIREHYITGSRRHRYAERSRAVAKIATYLEHAALDDTPTTD